MLYELLTIDTDAEADGPLWTGNLTILIRIAKSGKVFGAAFGSDHFTYESSQNSEFASNQLAIAVFVQLVEFPLHHSSFSRLSHAIHLRCRTYNKNNPNEYDSLDRQKIGKRKKMDALGKKMGSSLTGNWSCWQTVELGRKESNQVSIESRFVARCTTYTEKPATVFVIIYIRFRYFRFFFFNLYLYVVSCPVVICDWDSICL